MKILFFPSDLGGGFGHINRCEILAETAVARGHSCAFVLNDDKYLARMASKFHVFYTKNHCLKSLLFRMLSSLISQFRKPSYQLFMEFSTLDFQVLRDGLVNDDIIMMKVKEYCSYVREFKPDVLVGDMNFLTWIVSRITSVPLAQIVRYGSHPDTAKIIWWKNVPADVVPPAMKVLFNPLMKKLGLGSINKIEDLFRGDVYIIPSIPEIEPVPEGKMNIFTGAFIGEESCREDENNEWDAIINSKKPLLYITIGGGAGPVGSELFFRTVFNAFSGNDCEVIISTGGKYKSVKYNEKNTNIRFFNWVPGKLLVSKADLVIFHGGYSTLLEVIAFGKPSIVIPFHSEQEGNGRRLEQLACGKVIKLCSETGSIVSKKWAQGEFKYIIYNDFALHYEELRAAFDLIISEKSFLRNSQKLMSKSRKYGGVHSAVDIVERTC